jgi:hypothetical protein
MPSGRVALMATTNTPAAETPEPVVPSAATAPEHKAMIQGLMAEIDRERAIEAQARKDATESGAISPYDVVIDQRGHLHLHEALGNVTRRKPLDHYLDIAKKATGVNTITHQFDDMAGEWAEGLTEDERMDVLSIATRLQMTRPCYWCGVQPVYSYDGASVTSTTACESPEGYPVEFALSVTSGKIVFAPDLGDVYVSGDDTYMNLGRSAGAFGQATEMRALAAVGCAFGFVPKSYFSLFQTDEGTYTIASPAYDKDGEITYDAVELADTDDDYWTYAIADHDDYVAKGGTFGEYGPTVVEVPNGVYHFTHHTFEKSFDPDAYSTTQVFATITRTDA